MTKIKGIDVSKHDGKIDWSKVKNSGIEFVIIRAGFGSSTIDERFVENIKGAIKENLGIGIYWFSYAISEEKARLEAVKCMDVIKSYKNYITYPVFYDFEYDSVRYAKTRGVSINKTKATDFAYAFLKEIDKGGYIPGLYTNIDYSNNYFSKELQKAYDLWIAQYSSRNSYDGDYAIWQYSENGKVSGIDGNVDLDYCYKTYKSYSSDENSRTDEDTKESESSKEESNEKIESEKADLVKELQKALNESYGSNLDIDGSFGPKTQAEVEKHPLTINKKYKKLAHTTWLQNELKNLGYNLDVDGHYGEETKSQVEAYQKDHNLDVDGMAGIKTHTSIVS